MKYAPVPYSMFEAIGHSYDSYPDDRANPAMLASYEAFLQETKQQYLDLVAAGYTIKPWLNPGEPYGVDSRKMCTDVIQNKRLFYLRSRAATGQGNENDSAENYPPFADSGIRIDGEVVLMNDLFRAVHDINGHAAFCHSFSTEGEWRAYLSHSQMYSDKARPALFMETVIYNAYYFVHKAYAPRKIIDTVFMTESINWYCSLMQPENAQKK